GRRLRLPVQPGCHPARPVLPREHAMTSSPTSAASAASTTAPLRGLLSAESPSVATAGVGLFADALRGQAVTVTETDWQPPMAGTEADLARVMADARRAKANATAYARLIASTAELCDVKQAKDALGLERGTFLHAGPPIDWDRASGPLR